MSEYGLVGRKLGHSYSESYFKQKFEKENLSGFRYKNFELESIEKLPDLVSHHHKLQGLNITIPFKEEVIPFLSKIDRNAGSIGAVNTICIHRKGKDVKLTGYNTDYLGFIESIKGYLKPHHNFALILGTGGSAKAVSHALNILGISHIFVSRTKCHPGVLTYENLSPALLSKHKLLINCTPVGMYPHIHESPDLIYQAIGPDHLLFDLVYNPMETQFLKKGRLAGATIVNGLEMLQLQAEYAWKIWNHLI